NHQQRVAVGRRFCGRLGADDGSGAGPVLHHKRLLERLAQLLAERTREDIGRTAGAEWHDHLDRTRRIILRARRRCRREPNHRQPDERRDLLKYRHGPARLREKAKGGNWVRTGPNFMRSAQEGSRAWKAKSFPMSATLAQVTLAILPRGKREIARVRVARMR